MSREYRKQLELLAPAFPPARLPNARSWADAFEENLDLSEDVTVVTGFASEASMVKTLEYLRLRSESSVHLRSFNLVIGYAFFDGLTQRQIKALRELNNFLSSEGLGYVRIPLGIKVHSKISLFSGPQGRVALMGSSNFTELIVNRKSELDLLITDDQDVYSDMVEYVALIIGASSPVDEKILGKIPVLRPENPVLLSSPLVLKTGLPPSPVVPEVCFMLPLKPEPKSNLNKFRAAPRVAIPRSWWEVEIIVPTPVQKSEGFPSQLDGSNRFQVFTNDGVSFPCHVSGGTKPRSNKNLESSGDLRLLGYWVKGKMLELGALEEGEPVTEDSLKKFGYSFLKMTKLEGSNQWLLEFQE